jgi:hypothetical protein
MRCSLTIVTAIIALFSIPITSFAATITENEAGAEALLEHTVGAQTIDIDLRFNESVTLKEPTLLSVDSVAELTAIFALAPVASPTISLFFIDSLNWCEGSQPSAVGCASGAGIVLESDVAAGGNGPELLAHELGHTYGLAHLESPTTNIMNCCDWGNTTFTETQLQTINGSPRVQDDSGTQFTAITPVLITTPEPGTLPLSMLGLAIVTWRRRAARRNKYR